MTQRDRDRLVALKKAKKGLITQRQAAAEIGSAKSSWMENFRLTSPEKAALSAIAASSQVRSLKPIR